MNNNVLILCYLIICITLFSCDDKLDQENPNLKWITDGFNICFGNSYILTHEEIEHYDFSTHFIYLKGNNQFLTDYYETEGGKLFIVYANKEEIYTGKIHSLFSCSLPFPSGLFFSYPHFYPEYIIAIDYSPVCDSISNCSPDPRYDKRIINALKKYDQFHAGLKCAIDTIIIHENNQVSVQISVLNNDSFNYYILSPDKMGIGLFHYYTNGLILRDFKTSSLRHLCEIIHPEPWNTWNIEWMDLLQSGNTRSYVIDYYKFQPIPSGEYQASIEFPGLHSQVSKEELQREDGRIWLGEILTSITIIVE